MFTTDDSIYLLPLIKKPETELDLAKENYPANITLSLEHSEEASRFVADTFYIDEYVANDYDLLKDIIKKYPFQIRLPML
jgi:hypothetical protein